MYDHFNRLKPTQTTIYYKTKKPEIYNKGTVNETYQYEFLIGYTYKSKEEAEKEVAEINRTHPNVVYGRPIDWNNIDYFFVNEQKSFDN